MAEGEYVCGACGARASRSDRVGLCPSCKNGFLQPVGAGAGGKAAQASVSSSSASEGPKRVVAALLLFGALLLIGKFGHIAWDRVKFPSEPVKGELVSQHLGVTMTLEQGWRHLKKEDRSEHFAPEQLAGGVALDKAARARVGGGDLHTSMFFRGKTSSRPDDGLLVGVLELQSAEMRQLIAGNLLEAARAGAANLQDSVGRWEVSLGDCTGEGVEGYRFARCTGKAAGEGDQANVVFYLYATGRGVGMVLLLSHDPPDAAATRARTILLSMK